MSLAYFDTSALLKNYIQEAGSRGFANSSGLTNLYLPPSQRSSYIQPYDAGIKKVRSPDRITIRFSFA